MRTWTLGVGLLALAVSGLAQGDEAKVAGDLKKLQGTWILPAGENELRWVFEGDTMKARFNDSDFVTKVTINEKASPHPTIDFEIVEGPEDGKGKTAKAIYKLDGDKLTLCVALPDQDSRPNEFRGLENETMLFHLKREAK
jgi:uncharacterized protein (TIGR03067 family)